MLCGIITIPSGWRGAGVVLCHGFNSHKDATTYRTVAERLVQQGIAALRFDFFGHGESGGAFEDITISEAKENTLSAIQYLQAKGCTRIGLFGGSFGGWASLLAAAEVSALSVLALKSPVSDYWEKEQLTAEEIKQWKHEGFRWRPKRDGRSQKLKYGFYEDALLHSAYRVAGAITAPALIVHGDADESVPLVQSKTTAGLIPNCRLEVVPGADHGYSKPEDFVHMVSLVAEFLVNHLQ